MGQPHKHADLIKAWADGAEIQCREGAFDFWKDNSYPNWRMPEYRIKPKLKVKRWLWVYESKSGRLSVTHFHYHDFADYTNSSVACPGVKFIQKVDSTMIEVEDE